MSRCLLFFDVFYLAFAVPRKTHYALLSGFREKTPLFRWVTNDFSVRRGTMPLEREKKELELIQ